MSEQYPGGFISKTPPTPDGTTAQGMWTLSQAAGYQKQGLWPVPYIQQYIEDVFQDWVYTGNGSTQTITNGVDLSGKGGLVWTKYRSGGDISTASHSLIDTLRGPNNTLATNLTNAQQTFSDLLTSFSSTGYVLGADASSGRVNRTNASYVSWTFREQPKFFDIQTWTGNGVAGRQIPHNLGSVPGCIIIKATNSSGESWEVYHRSLGNDTLIFLNYTDPKFQPNSDWNYTSPTSTAFTVSGGGGVNYSGYTYVAYIFAHNAGGFGLTGTDNVISCGSYTGNGSANGPEINLGYEPQWLLVKNASGSFNWLLMDNMRGMPVSGDTARLFPNTSGAESTAAGFNYAAPTATGFKINTDSSFTNANGSTYIYIAIRRGPMKVPTLGTTVFSPQVQTPTGSTGYVMAGSSGFPVDWIPTKQKNNVIDWYSTSRLTNNYLSPNTTAAEGAYTYGFDLMQGVSAQWDAQSTVSYAFRRAPSVFDVVCYTGTGSTQTIAHNLTVAPELMIVKSRSAVVNWKVYEKDLGTLYGSGNPAWQYNLTLNSTASTDFSTSRWSQDPTATVFGVATNADTNGSGSTYVAYLFASCPGVSKVGSVTHVEPTTVVCGFVPRFVMIKSTTATGTDDWFVFDSARGITAGNDPYLRLNSTGAENTPFGAADLIDVTSDGFVMNGFGGGTYIFLAIA
jgi:hypothetical protein